jgi:hypothetical protein
VLRPQPRELTMRSRPPRAAILNAVLAMIDSVEDPKCRVLWHEYAFTTGALLLQMIMEAAGKTHKDLTSSAHVHALWSKQAAFALNIDSTTEAWQKTSILVAAIVRYWSSIRTAEMKKKFPDDNAAGDAEGGDAGTFLPSSAQYTPVQYTPVSSAFCSHAAAALPIDVTPHAGAGRKGR